MGGTKRVRNTVAGDEARGAEGPGHVDVQAF